MHLENLSPSVAVSDSQWQCATRGICSKFGMRIDKCDSTIHLMGDTILVGPLVHPADTVMQQPVTWIQLLTAACMSSLLT